jgi:hypothetical protein
LKKNGFARKSSAIAVVGSLENRDDGSFVPSPDRFDQSESGKARHHVVGQDQVRAQVLEQLEAFLPVGGPHGLVARLREPGCEDSGGGGVVVHDQEQWEEERHGFGPWGMRQLLAATTGLTKSTAGRLRKSGGKAKEVLRARPSPVRGMPAPMGAGSAESQAAVRCAVLPGAGLVPDANARSGSGSYSLRRRGKRSRYARLEKKR